MPPAASRAKASTSWVTAARSRKASAYACISGPAPPAAAASAPTTTKGSTSFCASGPPGSGRKGGTRRSAWRNTSRPPSVVAAGARRLCASTCSRLPAEKTAGVLGAAAPALAQHPALWGGPCAGARFAGRVGSPRCSRMQRPPLGAVTYANTLKPASTPGTSQDVQNERPAQQRKPNPVAACAPSSLPPSPLPRAVRSPLFLSAPPPSGGAGPGGGFRVHRGLLQPEAAALVAGLRQSSGL